MQNHFHGFFHHSVKTTKFEIVMICNNYVLVLAFQVKPLMTSSMESTMAKLRSLMSKTALFYKTKSKIKRVNHLKDLVVKLYMLIYSDTEKSRHSRPFYSVKSCKGLPQGKIATTLLYFWLQIVINQGFQMRYYTILYHKGFWSYWSHTELKCQISHEKFS